jgi:hypothetical protein
MGLDMYLYENVYMSNWPHSKEADEAQYTDALSVLALAGIKPDPQVGGYGVEVKTPVVYWRKANAIHLWFVAHCQNAVDDCGNYDVEDEQLTELVELCRKVLDASKLVPDMVSNGQTRVDGKWQNNQEMGQVILDPSTAEELLPSGEGFFFGSTAYDQWYHADLVHTVAAIEGAMAHRVEGSGFEYHSSW